VSLARLTAAALVVAAIGIVIQILSGKDYPTVPPELIILLVPAILVWFVRWRWIPAIGGLAALTQLIGLFAASQSSRLWAMDPIGDSVGLWLQLVAVCVATVAGFAAVIRGGDRSHTSRSAA
jgi:hypothetical protein